MRDTIKKLTIYIWFLAFMFLLYQWGAGQSYCNKYNAYIFDVYDGDTYTATIEVGLRNIQITEKLRIYGLDCPEVRGSEKVQGLAVRDSVRQILLNQEVVIEHVTYGKFGRMVCHVYRASDMLNIGDWLISKGLCEFKEY